MFIHEIQRQERLPEINLFAAEPGTLSHSTKGTFHDLSFKGNDEKTWFSYKSLN